MKRFNFGASFIRLALQDSCSEKFSGVFELILLNCSKLECEI